MLTAIDPKDATPSRGCTMADERLKKELETYERHKDELVSQSEGKFVLIHGDLIAGVFDTYKDALGVGYRQFGLEPFLVKQVQGIEKVQFFTRGLMPCQS